MPKGYALLVGLISVDPETHENDEMREGIEGCEIDVDLMTNILNRFGYQCQILKTEAATSESILKSIEDLASTTTSEDIVVIYYSGHGTQHYDYLSSNIEEEDGLDECLVAYDRDILDDDIFRKLQLFKDNTRVIFICDACHSGTAFKSINPSESHPPPPQYLFNAIDSNDLESQLIYIGASKDEDRIVGLPQGSALTTLIGQFFEDIPEGNFYNLKKYITERIKSLQDPSFILYGKTSENFTKNSFFEI